ncbi:MAG TPA: type II toxin-antitoxin system HicA family toxin [Verrucomicrobiales bacterium]|jgi:predicted RNA binding protein YcfA (HicA-like mRNA interferase family)|nr:type II toxin-antitoxin system HicA family toxin [Verrucomicrobiales bacterium]
MKFPRDIAGREVIAALRRLGFTVQRQTGSHVQLQRDNTHVTVPMHNPVRTGTLKNVLRQAGVTMEQLLENL